MNRIYQGRVSRAELLDKNGKSLETPPPWDGIEGLWTHHALFQDAVNYYVVCLLALAGPTSALFQIREKLDAPANDGTDDELMVWRPFRRRGTQRRGLRDSVAKYLTPSNATPTPQECFAAALAGNQSTQDDQGRQSLNAALTQLLGKCTGDSGCRNSSKEFLPRFCSPDYGGSYAEDSTTLARANLALRLPFVVHDATTTAESSALDEFGVHAIALPNAKKPKFCGKDAVEKLRDMLAEWRKRLPNSEADWSRLDAVIGDLARDFQIPGYAPTSAKGEKRFQLFAMFLFRYVERSAFTLNLLRATTRKPPAGETAPVAVGMASGPADPIRTARGTRGYVFRAFTSLPCWARDAGDNEATPRWVQFDFASFCEALKALHQVEAKGEERKSEQAKKRALIEYQRGRTHKLPLASSEAGDRATGASARVMPTTKREHCSIQ